MNDALLVLFYFLVFLFIPGFIGVVFFRKKIDSLGFLLSFSLSYALFYSTHSIYTLLGFSLIGFKSFISPFYAACLLTAALLVFFRRLDLQKNIAKKEFLTGLIIAFLVIIHHLITGPYDQIPSDVLAHLTRFKKVLFFYSDGIQNPINRMESVFFQKPQIWYHLVAISTQGSDLSTYQILNITTLLTKTIFVLSVYIFGLIVFEKSSSRVIISCLSTLFACLHFGVNIFSYMQYYSFAPAILSFSLYLAGVAVFITYLNDTINAKSSFITFSLLLLIFGTILRVHYQEALFLITTIFSMSIVGCYLNCKNEEKRAAYLISLSLLILGLICFIVSYLHIKSHFNLNPNNYWKLWELGKPVSWLPALKVLNLKYQGVEVLTYWGAFIYLFFFITYKQFKNNIYLIAGMLSPFITVLNPVFIDFITRIAPVNFVYRLLYIVPIYYIAGFCFVLSVQNIINKPSKRIYSSTFLLGLILVFFIPIHTSSHKLGFSRIETLLPVAKNEGYDRFEDLLEFLDKQPSKYILTDPVLGYTIDAFTHHKYNSFTFRKNFNRFTFNKYSSFPIASRRSGWFLIVNKRNDLLNTKSRAGKLSRHWPEDLFNVNSYYPENLIQHIRNNRDLFIPVWSSKLNDIKIYQVKKYRPSKK